MRLKRIMLWGIAALLLYAAYIAVSLAILPPVSDLKNRKTSIDIQVRDWQGNYHPLTIGPKNRNWTPTGSIPSEMKWSVILAEDANFYRHEGIDVRAIKNAIRHDLEKKTFARGASTITQQTAKNLFLSREKSITRKIKELYLALRMEQELTKGRIVELYLNVVELGPMVYGIGHGSRYYFGKPASALTPRECAFLASMLPGPRIAYNPYKNLDKVLKRSDMILGLLRKKGVLTEEEYRQALAEVPNVGRLQQKVNESINKEVVLENLSTARGPKGEEPLPEPPGTAVDTAPQEGAGGTPDVRSLGGKGDDSLPITKP